MGIPPSVAEGFATFCGGRWISDTEGGRGCEAVMKIFDALTLGATAPQGAFDSRQSKRDKAGCGAEDGCGFGRYGVDPSEQTVGLIVDAG
jgi:hypothetical protein